eukprot:scpid46966/ scgid4488/ Protein O-mannosyltransferase 1; Dolichyl-phosphate-mannose--protein mannosyltransferase 1; Protein rotated abdomen
MPGEGGCRTGTEKKFTSLQRKSSNGASVNGQSDTRVTGVQACGAKEEGTGHPSDDDTSTQSTVGYHNNTGNMPRCIRASPVTLHITVDIIAVGLLLLGVVVFTWRISTPRNVVFDEVHVGKFINFYIRGLFFLDAEPPFGKLVLTGVASWCGYDGQFAFSEIGQGYAPSEVPYTSLRLVTALCGGCLPAVVYAICIQLRIDTPMSMLAGVFLILDTAIITQSRYFMLDSMMLLSSLLAVFFALRSCRVTRAYSMAWFLHIAVTGSLLGLAISTKHAGFLTLPLVAIIISYDMWLKLPNQTYSMRCLCLQTIGRLQAITTIPVSLYLLSFYIHFSLLKYSGPHDALLPDQLKQGLVGSQLPADQTLYKDYFEIAYGSHIMLQQSSESVNLMLGQDKLAGDSKDTSRRASEKESLYSCWLHSHTDVYPVAYDDGRNSSQQQQVTCYPFKDMNNWWIVRKPGSTSLSLDTPPQIVRDGDSIELVHGTTKRLLNSHNVAAPICKTAQEVSGFINNTFPGFQKWRVDIIGEDAGTTWRASKHEVRIVHEETGSFLSLSTERLPEWGFHQMEVVAALKHNVKTDAGVLWKATEHQYAVANAADPHALSQADVQKSLIRNASQVVNINLLTKLWHYQLAVMSANKRLSDEHEYSTSALDWPLLYKGVPYWLHPTTNTQVYLIGNPVLWYSGTASLLLFMALYLLMIVLESRQSDIRCRGMCPTWPCLSGLQACIVCYDNPSPACAKKCRAREREQPDQS